MSEIAKLEAIEATFGYLRRPGDTSHLIDNAAAFTRHAAWELRAAGWGLVRKTTGLERQGLDVDKILHRTTLEMVDIVIAAGDPAQRVGWQPVATGTPSQWVEPMPPAGVTPPPSPPGEPEGDMVRVLRDELRAVRSAIEALHTTERASLAILERAAARFRL